MADDWLKRLVEKSGRHRDSDFSAVDKLSLPTQAINNDIFDARSYNEIREEALDLRDLSQRRAVDNPSWTNLIQDAYLALWKAKPHLRGPDEIRPSHLVNQMTLDKVMSITDYNQLRTWTTLDDWPAAMGTLSIAAKLEDFFDEQKDLVDQMKDLQEQEQDLIEMRNRLQQEAEEGLTEEALDELLDDFLKKLTSYAQAIETHEDTVDGAALALKVAVKAAMDNARKKVDEAESLVSYFGTDPGQWTKLDPKKRLELAKRMSGSPTLQEVAKLLGRIKRMAVGQWTRRVIRGTDEIYSVTLGKDLEHLVPSELIYLADKDLEPVFWDKYVEGTLLNYELRGTERMAQGAMFCLLDNSGSMRGQPEWYGKSVAISLLDIAKREGRDFYGIHFSSPGEFKEWFFPKGNCELADVLDFASYFSGGGTDFETPLTRAVEVLSTQFMEAGSVRGDIIMITDGECRVSPAWMEEWFEVKEKLDFKLYGMLIGSDWHTIDTLSDRLYRLEELMKGDDIREVFTLI